MVYEGDELPMQDTDKVFSVEALPGQFDQRADSAEQCVKLLNEDEDPIIKTATTYILSGNVREILDKKKIKVFRTFVGEYATSMEMAGASISICKMADEEMKEQINMPVHTPFYTQV